jgi:hypothetical protein
MEILNLFRKAKEIDPDHYGIDIGGFPIAESGSSVYKGFDNGRPVALKVYRKRVRGQIGFRELRRYQQIAKKAANAQGGRQVLFPGSYGGQDCLTLEINQIEEIGKLKGTGEASSISEFIEGPTLQEDIRSGKYDSSAAGSALVKLSNELNGVVETNGISVVPVNAKVVGGELIVTDLYAQVQRLREETI